MRFKDTHYLLLRWNLFAEKDATLGLVNHLLYTWDESLQGFGQMLGGGVGSLFEMFEDLLDMRQQATAAQSAGHLPVLFFTQLMGIAFGLPAERLGLGYHMVDPRPLLSAVPAQRRFTCARCPSWSLSSL